MGYRLQGTEDRVEGTFLFEVQSTKVLASLFLWYVSCKAFRVQNTEERVRFFLGYKIVEYGVVSLYPFGGYRYLNCEEYSHFTKTNK